VADLRSRLYAHLIQLGAGFHDRSRSGELVSRLTADSELLRSVVGSTMSVALRSSVTVVGSLAMLFVTSPRLAAWSLLGIPLAVLPIIIGARKLRTVARSSQDRIADANSLASETLGAVRTVQAHAREPYERGRFDKALGDAISAARRRIGAQSLVTASAILLVFGAIVGVLWLGAHDVIDGRLSAGTLGQFVLYALIGGGSVGALAEVWNELQRAAGGMGRIGELLQEDIEIRAGAAARAAATAAWRNPVRRRGVPLSAASGPGRAGPLQPACAPGRDRGPGRPVGAGKSTVLSMLLRFHDPASGRICVDGIDVRQVDPAELRAQLALVPQQPTLFAASARDNIRYGRLQASDAEVEAAARAAEADGFLRALPQGYDSELGERGARLSGGQQQRVAIARALLKDAPILLLDEATSALDAQSEHSVQQALERLMAGRTTLVIAHRLATVLKADRIVVMDQGRIVAEGTHAQLLAEGGLYAELARLQFID
jgi:ATP-binding cassette subfamily B protein